MIGTTISHYKILEKLGEGGMGVVYKAEDTKLKREVAIKFLPRHVAVTEEERERFKIEAQAAAALNHPNIATIHAIEEIDEDLFIVMEFIEGQELKQLIIDNSQLSMINCLSFATQIAEGLKAAHAKGVTHRDIKSSNIMVTESGQVKIMDFGLAKIGSGAHLTKSGMTLGTAAYMSPEQVRGEPVDHRTDIWSFGVVLYEMLTGRLPFRGEYEQAIMYAIVNEEPEPVQKYRPELSLEFLHVLNRVLEKLADERYQSVSDILIDLRRLKKGTGSVASPLPGEMRTASRAAIAIPRASKKKTWLVLGALVVLAIAVSVLLLLPQRATELNPNMTFRVLPIPFAQNNYPSLSPDGNWLVFPAADANGKWDVYLMNTNGGEPRRITVDSSDYIEGVSISPDGAYIIYDRRNEQFQKSELCIVSSLGGTSKIVVGIGGSPDWRPDGQRIGYILGFSFTKSKSGKLEFWSVKPDGSDNRLEFVDSTVAGNSTRCSVSWSPDGKSVAWIRTFPEGHAEVIVRELESGKERQLTFDQKKIDEVCWTPNDQIIFSSTKGGNTNLWMVPAGGGQTIQITKGSGPDLGMAISDSGEKLAYLQKQDSHHLWLARVDGSNARQIIFDEHVFWGDSFFSPDGERLLACFGDPDVLKPGVHPYVMNRDGSNRQQISSGAQYTAFPRWSPDGKWIAYCAISTSEPVDSVRAYLVEASNLGNPRLLGRGFTRYWMDSQSIVLNTKSNSWLLFVDGKEPQKLSEDSTIAVPIFGEKHVLLQDLRKGREGWWIAATTNWRSPAMRPLKKILEALPSNQVRLAPSRKFLLYSKNAEELWKITLPEGNAQRLPGTFPFLKSDFNVSYDGQEIVWVDHRQQSKLVMIENLFK